MNNLARPRLASLLFGLAFVAFSANVPNVASAQYANWYDADLEPIWQSQVDAGRTTGGAAYVIMHVSESEFTTTHELIHNGQSTYFSPGDLDNYGNPVGAEGAAKAADVSLRSLASKGAKGELLQHRIPKITIFAQTKSGSLHMIDGESGETLHTFSVGDATLSSLSPAANDKYAAVINGSTLYVINLKDKKTAFHKRLGGAPAAGPAISKNAVYVPLVGGIVESYELETKRKYNVAKRFFSAGNTHVRPIVGSKTISWPTDRGFLYVIDTDIEKVRFRLEARSELVSHSTHLPPNRLLATSVEGYVFCFDELTGGMLWEFSAGEAILQSAAGAGDHVFAVTSQSNLFAVDAKSGRELWKVPGIKQVLSIGTDRVYCLGERRLVVLDRKSGGVLNSTAIAGDQRFITNLATDRIYMASRSGRIVCLRQQGKIWPTIHIGEAKTVPAKSLAADKADGPSDATVTKDKAPVTAEAAEAMAGAAADEDDLFGGGSTDAADEDDLFGGDEMPADDGGSIDDLFE